MSKKYRCPFCDQLILKKDYLLIMETFPEVNPKSSGKNPENDAPILKTGEEFVRPDWHSKVSGSG